MGTSASSKGPGSGVSMVPPWVPDIVLPATQPDSDETQPIEGNGQNRSLPTPNSNLLDPVLQTPEQIFSIAPARRFASARKNFGSFGRSNDKKEMRRGMREYVCKGYRGKATAVRRFGGTISTASALYGALSSIVEGQPAVPGSLLDRALLAGKSAREIIDAVVEAIRPIDGTQDAEANRIAIKEALSKLLTLFPDADLLSLTEDQRAAAIENFVALDIYHRVVLDIGKTIQEKAQNAAEGLSRLKDVKDFIKETVAASFRKLSILGNIVNSRSVNIVVKAAIHGTFQVFEEWVQ